MKTQQRYKVLCKQEAKLGESIEQLYFILAGRHAYQNKNLALVIDTMPIEIASRLDGIDGLREHAHEMRYAKGMESVERMIFADQRVYFNLYLAAREVAQEIPAPNIIAWQAQVTQHMGYLEQLFSKMSEKRAYYSEQLFHYHTLFVHTQKLRSSLEQSLH